MNIRTLKSLHPTSGPTPLTATQMISLHLYINRPHGSEDSLDSHYGPYISTLPREFDSHPLTWIVQSKRGMETGGVPLLKYLPSSVYASLVKLHDRFYQDWDAVRVYLQTANSYISSKYDAYLDHNDVSTSNYLWAWLNVNTRCIYYRLKASREDPDNLTLCPILDFANHTPNGLHSMIPAPSEADIWDAAPVKPTGFGFLSPADASVQEGEEIFLAYGAHPSRTLFIEYGFVNKLLSNVEITDGEVDVQDVVESLILDHKSGVFVKSVLQDKGYWGDWILYCSAESAQPSWRLITALRLHCLIVSNHTMHHNAIQPWCDVIAGKREMISDGNELAWKELLITICDTIITKAQASLDTLESEGAEYGHSGSDGWLAWMCENIRTLWREELSVAAAVKERTLRGDDF
ncbi:uncharacterized protein EDB93DRAFT_1176375 [Suillus bovinus]|uniref:uncharacterized protein n=1 Tax=Suillus bovinus TaxID=48563 RepID=UPI001B85EB7D|nr:uncharacterized protein EDB93DRAFT_1176375 [Suillus bovinus]KAG2132498.1 hypothetical protein EDB93DRAFT_1176375 [Suillus bovinus]